MVDVTRQALQIISISLYKNLIAAYGTKSSNKIEQAANNLFILIADMDRVLLTNEYFLLGRWLQGAKMMGGTQAEKKLLEFNARNQITMWGPHDNIEDYANKMWSGLLVSYYKARWRIFVDLLLVSIDQGVPFNETLFLEENYKLEYSWNWGQKKYPDVPREDTYSIVKLIHEKYRRHY